MDNMASARSSRRSFSIIKRLYALSIAMLLVLLAYAVWFNYYITSIDDEAYYGSTSAELDMLTRHVNSMLSDLNNIENALLVDENALTILSIYRSGAQTDSTIYLQRLMDSLQRYVSANANISDIFVILPDADLVVSTGGTCTLDTFFRNYPCAQLRMQLENYGGRSESGIAISTYKSLYNTETKLDMAYQYSIKHGYIAAVIMMSREQLDNWLARLCSGKDMDLYLLTGDDELYAKYAAGSTTLGADEVAYICSSGERSVELDGQTLDALTVEVGDLNMVALFRRNGVSGAVTSNRWMLYLIGATFAILTLLLNVVLRHWFYAPLQGLLNTYAPETSGSADEYMRLRSVMNSMHTDIKSMEAKIQENEQYMRELADSSINTMSWDQALNVVKRNEFYKVFTLVVEDAQGVFQMSECRRFCLKLGESEGMSMTVYDRGDSFNGMIGYGDEAELAARLSALLDELAQRNAFVHLGMSMGHVDRQHMPLAHEECRIAFYQDSSELLSVYHPGMTLNNRYFAVSLAQQTKLASCVASGNADATAACLNEVYKSNEDMSAYWLSRLSGFLLDLLAILATNHKVDIKEIFDSSAAWTNSHNTRLLISHVYEAYDRLTRMLAIESDDIVERIKRYIDEHISDEITLSDAADYVGRSYNYISLRFSQVTGEMFSEYLQRRRIKRACELLLTTDMSVTDVAHNVGYRIPSSFIRLFKRETGMTPGQYRERNSNLPD